MLKLLLAYILQKKKIQNFKVISKFIMAAQKSQKKKKKKKTEIFGAFDLLTQNPTNQDS